MSEEEDLTTAELLVELQKLRDAKKATVLEILEKRPKHFGPFASYEEGLRKRREISREEAKLKGRITRSISQSGGSQER